MRGAPITVAILAGGAASRLGGRDKGLEPLRGRPLVAHVVDAIAAMAGADPPGGAILSADPAALLIVANRNRESYARHARTVGDDAPGFRGPLAGVATALGACAGTWLMTVPVDCPDPPRDLAARLLAAALRDDAPCVVAHDGERRQPLFALYRPRLAGSAAAAVAAGRGVRQWQDTIRARELDFSDRRRQFRNLNTADDFAAHAADQT